MPGEGGPARESVVHDKVTAITLYLAPTTKKELMR